MDSGTWQATVHGVAESETTEWLTYTKDLQSSLVIQPSSFTISQSQLGQQIF